jgi:dipeptidyl aminopeptidase/acylaminoacyl peptidase
MAGRDTVNTEQLISPLGERDVHHEYLLFEDEGHDITRTDNRVEYLDAATEFVSDIATNQ